MVISSGFLTSVDSKHRKEAILKERCLGCELIDQLRPCKMGPYDRYFNGVKWGPYTVNGLKYMGLPGVK